MAEIAESIDGIPHAAAVEPLAKEDWTESWKRFFHVLHITDRITVRPIWEAYSPAEGEIVIDIEPGMSFGTGIHQTTQSCIKFLQQLSEEGALERSVIDMGCGSGILAIAARKLGFNHVSGYDYDPSAVKTSIENASANGLEIPFYEGDALAPVLPSILSAAPVSCVLVTEETMSTPGMRPSIHVDCFVRARLATMSGGPERYFAGAHDLGWEGVVMSDDDWTGGLVTLAHRFGLLAFAEDVLREHRANDLIRMGADVMSGRWPERMVAARDNDAQRGSAPL
jgi:SAM-dependent methyltransferase